jgi:hypothetical protein
MMKSSQNEDLFTQPRAFFVLSERQRFFQSPLETIIKSERNEANHGKRARRPLESTLGFSLSRHTANSFNYRSPNIESQTERVANPRF